MENSQEFTFPPVRCLWKVNSKKKGPKQEAAETNPIDVENGNRKPGTANTINEIGPAEIRENVSGFRLPVSRSEKNGFPALVPKKVKYL